MPHRKRPPRRPQSDDSTERAAARRRREAIRRAEREANRFLAWLIAKGRPVFGETVADYFDQCKAEELAALARRELRRAAQ